MGHCMVRCVLSGSPAGTAPLAKVKKKKKQIGKEDKVMPTHQNPPTHIVLFLKPARSITRARRLWGCWPRVDHPVESVRDFLLARRPLGFHQSMRRTLASKSGELLLTQFASDNWTTQRASWFVPSGVVSLVGICTHPFMQEHCRTQCTAFGQLISLGPQRQRLHSFWFFGVFFGILFFSVIEACSVQRGQMTWPTNWDDVANERE